MGGDGDGNSGLCHVETFGKFFLSDADIIKIFFYCIHFRFFLSFASAKITHYI